MNDDGKNDSIEVRVGNSSTLVSSLISPQVTMIHDRPPITEEPLAITDGPSSEKKEDLGKDSSEV